MPFLLIAAAASFACLNPVHHDGDAIRCAGSKAMRLDSIDAPEMPGACRPGRACTPGDPYAARDHLASLTAGRSVTCEQRDTDHYGRRIVRCTADGVDLSCAMVADGYAVERYSALNCDTQIARNGPEYTPRADPYRAPASPPSAPSPADDRYYAPDDARPPAAFNTALFGAAALWLLLINIAAYVAFAIDKKRASTDPRNRIPEANLLMMAAFGGSIGAVTAQQRLRHKTRKQPFASWLLAISGLQIGAIAALIILSL